MHHQVSESAECHSDVGKAAGRCHVGTLAAAAAIVLLALWAGSTTIYILFRDDALKLVTARQQAVTRAYDAQVFELQAEVDRLKSLKLVEQARVDRAVDELSRRQTVLEDRQSALSALAELMRDAGTPPEVTGSLPTDGVPVPAAAPKPRPLPDTSAVLAPTVRSAAVTPVSLPAIERRFELRGVRIPTETRIATLAEGLTQLENAQGQLLNEVERHYDGITRRMQSALAKLDLGSRIGTSEAPSGGPFVPWITPPEDSFSRQLRRIRNAVVTAEELRRELAVLPVRSPVVGEAKVTSPFGVRLDPFLRQPALHSGIDFQAETGDPVQAAAGGTVVAAERNGGYGLMVEVDHGNGITSRYAHLSSILVRRGEEVRPGTLIGRAGSTGRSTGPHLHYEIRIDGDEVDPERFLRAGLGLEPVL